MSASPCTVEEYLATLPEDRREALSAVRDVIRRNLPEGYEEGIQYGMIGYYVPHRLYPAGYHCDPKQPLPFAHLASQKNHMALYLFCLYTDGAAMDRFTKAWRQTGKKLSMGTSCVRFKKREQVALDVVGETIRSISVKQFIDGYEASLRKRK